MSQTLATDQECITTLRMLAIDAIERARSGHPGLPLGAAPMAYVLWSRFLRHQPANPNWSNRDRFVLSAGHGSALLYALLHLSGYDLSLDELKNFRQLNSRCPGHPEYGDTPGVEATTGPLGQGVAMATGMALAEKRLAESWNGQCEALVDHYTYALVSDGDLMEGIGYEAASLAGALGLGKLIFLYDDNKISIEGDTDLAFTENVEQRFQSFGWQTITVSNGEDLDAIEAAIRSAQSETWRPSLIRVRTRIGFGSPKVDTAGAHGSPIVGEAMEATRKAYGWTEERFHVPENVRARFSQLQDKGRAAEGAWRKLYDAFRHQSPKEAKQFEDRMNGDVGSDWVDALENMPFDSKLATRSASGKSINAIAPHLPMLIGGSADLAPSNNTWINDPIAAPVKRNIHFGIREHAMAAVCNGLALHGGWRPFCGTFLVFSDYMRGAIRLSALMDLPVVYVLTHDSAAVGEDGPTHQPVEHVASLRAMPNLTVIRPADAWETANAWQWALKSKKPTALILSRQNLPLLPREGADELPKGGYVVEDCQGTPKIILIATGAEVHLALEARRRLEKEGTKARVVAIPSWELFEAQSESYRNAVLPPDISARVAIEAGSSLGWERYTGHKGRIIALDRFGVSAPGDQALETLGFSIENVMEVAHSLIKK